MGIGLSEIGSYLPFESLIWIHHATAQIIPVYLLLIPWVSVDIKTSSAVQVMRWIIFVFVALIAIVMNCPIGHPVDTLVVCVVVESSTRIICLFLIGFIRGCRVTVL
jgi:hypothetical protein